MAKILVVDDDAGVRGVLERILTRGGHQAVLASDGHEAIGLLASTPCDMVITDINMPDMDGIELILTLEDISRGTPVIAISGGGLIEAGSLLSDAQGLGAVGTITKPFRPDEVLALVDRALAS